MVQFLLKVGDIWRIGAEMLLVVELDGRPWWNSTCIQRAKTLAAPYLQHGRRVIIRSHESSREKVAIRYDPAGARWTDLLTAELTS
jgi:hypothetical protein